MAKQSVQFQSLVVELAGRRIDMKLGLESDEISLADVTVEQSIDQSSQFLDLHRAASSRLSCASMQRCRFSRKRWSVTFSPPTLRPTLSANCCRGSPW